jgi:beta-phosphoglucomutase-like phosphatase (HAD superfamily)
MCLCTSIDATSINASLAKLGIQDYFSAFVTAEDDVETRAQM